MSARRLSHTTMTARRPGAGTGKAYQTLGVQRGTPGVRRPGGGGAAGALDKRPRRHYYAAVAHLPATCPQKERCMTKIILTVAAALLVSVQPARAADPAAQEKFPASRSEIKRVFADGDYVILHVHAVREPETRGNAIVDIFKLENGKIVEHWDVVQPIPEKAANANGMF
jgi:SnoaL-like domain